MIYLVNNLTRMDDIRGSTIQTWERHPHGQGIAGQKINFPRGSNRRPCAGFDTMYRLNNNTSQKLKLLGSRRFIYLRDESIQMLTIWFEDFIGKKQRLKEQISWTYIRVPVSNKGISTRIHISISISGNCRCTYCMIKLMNGSTIGHRHMYLEAQKMEEKIKKKKGYACL